MPDFCSRRCRHGGDAAFGDEDPVLWRAGGKFLAVFQRHLEIAEVAVVDADQRRLQRQGAVEFGLVMGFDQNVHLQVMGGDVERAGFAIVDAGHDDQDAVGAGGAGLVDLIGVEQEILAQGRRVGGGAGDGEIVQLALERGRVGGARKGMSRLPA